MNARKWLSLFICFVMMFTCITPAFANSGVSLVADVDDSVWTPEDFTYGEYEKLLYGCDYTREIIVKGVSITGFSKSGETKLETNKDLVVPANDENGNVIVAIGQSAFSNKGLKSVEFPTGMMVDYDDTITQKVTKRGNFIIAENAFAGNELTEVRLPEGVIAVLPHAFNNNKIETVKLPRTIWWLETYAFANNRITEVDFPTTCDFQLEMHGMTFAHNFIKSVRLPDFTEVVNMYAFFLNTGMEPITEVADPDKFEYFTKYQVDGQTYDAGMVYMYADNSELEVKDRIHHYGKSTASQKSYVQKLIINEGDWENENPDEWNIDDFTVEGTTVTGLSESGIAKRKINKDLVIPEITSDYRYITEIASASPGGYGIFATETEKFDSVYLPSGLKVVGNFAFQNSGIKEVTFSPALLSIGTASFQSNELTSIILPDTVTSLGQGVFATNPKLERINLPKGLTVIPEAAFGCSDKEHYMTNLKNIELREGITEIGTRAFAGNNFTRIETPSTLKTIGDYAFSTKNYLTTPCELILNEGLAEIGKRAFRNKVIDKVIIPKTVKGLYLDTFEKAYSDDTEAVVTKVFVSLQSQYEDKENFPESNYHKIYLMDATKWTSEDFEYGTEVFELESAAGEESALKVEANVVTGFSESGKDKFDVNKDVVIPENDDKGQKVQGVGKEAFKGLEIQYITFPEETNASAILDGTGAFFIGASAFEGAQLTSVTLPKGVAFVGRKAFESNKLSYVEFTESIMFIGDRAFADNVISSVNLPDLTDSGLQIIGEAFAGNKIKTVQIPSNTEKVDANTFAKNAGMEVLTEELEGGLVYIYIDTEDISFVSTLISHNANETNPSSVQKLIAGKEPDVMAPWNINDFTYDESGTIITGLSAVGKLKLKENPKVVIPNIGSAGLNITALGEGTLYTGIFVYEESERYYTPETVTLPSSLEKIGKYAFALNPNITYEATMTSIVFNKGLKEIGDTAFQNSKLTSVELSDSVTLLGDGAFTGSGDITYIRLSESLTEIPKSAFNAGSVIDMQIKEIVIPEGVKNIGESAFAGTHVEKIEIPSTLTTIGKNAFWNHQLKELEIPGNVEVIEDYAFRITQENVSVKLEKLVLNEGLVSIGREAFSGNAIKEVYLPSTVELSSLNSSKDCIFGNARVPASPIVTIRVLEASKVEQFNTEYANKYSHIVVADKLAGSGWTKDDFIYDEETGTLLGWSESGETKRLENKVLVLPDKTPEGNDIIAIGEAAFKIPDDEIRITKFGVDSPNGMTSVSLPAKVTDIGDEAFSQNALVTVDLTTVTSIGYRAFYGNDLTKVELPDTVTSMGAGAFATNDITELKLSAGVTVIPQGAFSMNIRMEQVIIPETVTEIGTTAFAGARLTSLDIPKSVTKIGEKAFHLHHLTELTIPGNVKELGDSAFEGTFKATTLTKLIIEEGVEVIGDNCFKEALLETVHFPNSITSVGTDLFLNNKGLDGSKVVEVTTDNYEHTKFVDDTYTVKYLAPSIENFMDKVVLEYTEKVYTGSPLEPTVVIEGLTENIDFEVSYSNNDNVGTATITITGIEKYAGAIIKHFKINERYNPFIDIRKNAFYYDAVLWAVENKITDGVSPTKFAPDETCTRGQIVTFIWRVAGEPKSTGGNPFTDVKRNAYYAEAVKWAAENGITDGVSPTKFAPDDPCTRGQIVTFLWRAAGEPESNVNNVFVDVKNNTYYSEAVKWALENGITDGISPTKFAPDAPCTRGQVVTFLYRAEK